MEQKKFMRPTFAAALLTAASLVWGCASVQRPLVLDPVGPPLPYSPAAGPQGTLAVYSAFDATGNFNGNPYRHYYTNYRILTEDGQRVVKRVRNDAGVLAEGPRKVELPVGTYRVVARANGYGQVTVPAVIRAGQTTAVHLEGGSWWPNPAEIAKSNPVRLPRGEIVGWRASE
jgi:hypothetical protein